MSLAPRVALDTRLGALRDAFSFPAAVRTRHAWNVRRVAAGVKRIRALLRDRSHDSTRDASSAVSGWLRVLIVGIRVNDDRAAVGVKKRNGSRCKQHAVRGERDLSNAARGCDDVRRVTSVRTVRILEPVLFPQGIEMTTGS
jgi:hypothetical protein